MLRHEWGLDKSLPVQYVDYLGRVLHGNLGTSIYYQTSVASLIGHALPVTLAMLALGALFGIIFAVPLTLLAANRPGRPAEVMCLRCSASACRSGLASSF